MLTLTKNDGMSIDTITAVNEFAPLISLKARIETILEPADPLGFLHSKTSMTENGYAIFTNAAIPDVVESSPGVSTGGEIYILKDYICVVYLTGVSNFKVYKAFDMLCEFSQISPIAYISSQAAMKVGAPPLSYLPTSEGLIESFATSVCNNAPAFSQGFFVNGSPVALFGISVGTLAMNPVPSTKLGIAKQILRNTFFSPDIKQYGEEVGVYLSQRNITSAKTLIRKLAAGSKISLSGIFSYLRPESILRAMAKNFYTIQVVKGDPSEYDELVFLTDGRRPGFGVKDYVNGVNTKLFKYGDPALSDILSQYEAKIETLRRDTLRENLQVACEIFKDLIQAMATYTVPISVKTQIETDVVSQLVDVEFESKGINLGFKNIPEYPSKDIQKIPTLNSLELKSLYSTLFQKLAPVADLLDFSKKEYVLENERVELHDFKFNPDKLSTLRDEISGQIGEQVVKSVKSALSSITSGGTTVDLGKSIFSKHTGGCGGGSTQTMEVDNNGSEGAFSVGSGVVENKAKNKLSSFEVENVFFDKEDEKYKTVISFTLQTTPSADHSIVISDTAYSGAVASAIKSNIEKSGFKAFVTYAGYSANGRGAAVRKAKMDCLGCKFTSSYGVSPSTGTGFFGKVESGMNTYVASPAVNMKITITVPMTLSVPDFSLSAPNLIIAVQENLEKMESLVQYTALKFLISKLEERGLLKDIVFVGKLDVALLRLFDYVKFCDFDPSDSLKLLYETLKRLVNKNEGGLKLLSDEMLTGVEITLNDIELAMNEINVQIRMNNGFASFEKGQRSRIPWLMDFRHLNCEKFKEDLDLLPYYGMF